MNVGVDSRMHDNLHNNLWTQNEKEEEILEAFYAYHVEKSNFAGAILLLCAK